MNREPGRSGTPLRDAYADLVLGGRCVGCGASGRLVCARCRAGLPARAYPVRPDPAPPGLVPTVAAAPYQDLVKQLVLGFKERGLLDAAEPLSALLTLAVIEALGVTDVTGITGPAPAVLVPVPSRPSSVRARGLDPIAVLAGRSARLLRTAGVEARA
ncbi:MAG: hypothetical protein QM638_14665, partial [Nocardioides sp.]|uniref:ComF family protein n=1 Tax=Nocardioides sp. TaxID=35761 RepID=UPI0039E377E3